MAPLEYLRRAGLTVETVADKLRASPVERITPELRRYLHDHKTEILNELAVANDQKLRVWLHLLALADGCVIQRTGDLSTASVEQAARLSYGDDLLVVVAVPGVERPLTDTEIVKALAGTLLVPVHASETSRAWLAHVEWLLDTRPAELLESGCLVRHGLAGDAGTDAALMADMIRSSPAWGPPAQPFAQAVKVSSFNEEVERQLCAQTAATASPAWLAVRDQFYQHLMSCRSCYAPTERYCAVGAGLRHLYDVTPWGTNTPFRHAGLKPSMPTSPVLSSKR